MTFTLCIGAVFLWLIGWAGPALAEGFLYPVGDPDVAPSFGGCPTENGYRVTQGFHNTDGHTGVDLCTCEPKCAAGGDVRAAGTGTVVAVKDCGTIGGACGARKDTSFGNAVLIRHDFANGTTAYSLYGHMQDGSLTVAMRCAGGSNHGSSCVDGSACPGGQCQGNFVYAGNVIGRVGSTGDSRAPHLHFAITLQQTFRCGYIRKPPCLTDSFDRFREPLGFVADHRTTLPTAWVGSPVGTSCAGPSDALGRAWTDFAFDDGGSGWTPVALPDVGSLSGLADRFYRGHFTLSDPAPWDAYLFAGCNDGCEIYVNGQPLGSGAFGTVPICHRTGCVNLPLCIANSCVPPIGIPNAQLSRGDNVIAVHLSNGSGGSSFDATLLGHDADDCGNCALDIPEQCDPTVLQGPCNSTFCIGPGLPFACTCPVPSLCGDGLIEPGEQCDPGVVPDVCSLVCPNASCAPGGYRACLCPEIIECGP